MKKETFVRIAEKLESLESIDKSIEVIEALIIAFVIGLLIYSIM